VNAGHGPDPERIDVTMVTLVLAATAMTQEANDR
jgi:hypothetical protein